MPIAAPRVLTSIDAHAAGAAVRLVTSGLDSPPGRTLAMKARALDRMHAADFLALLREPRGHDGMTLAVLCEPTADADAGVLFRREHGYVPLPVAGLIAAATIAIERGLIAPRGGDALRLETGLGTLDLGIARSAEGRVEAVRCAMPPSFVIAGGVPIAVGTRTVPADVAWGGPWYVIVDSEAGGVPLARSWLPELRRLAGGIAAEVSRTLTLAHPVAAAGHGLGAVVFTGPAERSDVQLRALAISPDGFTERAPSGGALAAILAVLSAMGLATEDEFVLEGLAGTTLSGRLVGQTHVGDLAAIRASITGRAWITGEHRWHIDATDPNGAGFEW